MKSVLPQVFIAPTLGGLLTGGTLYNRELVREVARLGRACTALELEKARACFSELSGMLWVDSLYLEALPGLARAKQPSQRIGLLLHYLPALLKPGASPQRLELEAPERAAIDVSDAFLVTSPFMATLLGRLGAGARPVLCVEPGRFAAGLGEPPTNVGVRAALVANLAPNKGVVPFLQALARELATGDDFTLEIIGGDADSDYAAACRRTAHEHPQLAERVSFSGALPPERVVGRLALKNLLLSASLSESYGMALAEARTLGLPLIARRGGNVANLVERNAGGELVEGARELARAVVTVARDPSERARRQERARTAAWPARPWELAARDFVAQLELCRA